MLFWGLFMLASGAPIWFVMAFILLAEDKPADEPPGYAAAAKEWRHRRPLTVDETRQQLTRWLQEAEANGHAALADLWRERLAEFNAYGAHGLDVPMHRPGVAAHKPGA